MIPGAITADQGRGITMTDIDPRTDIGIAYKDDDLIVVIPLAGEVTEMWRQRYEALARAGDLHAQTEEFKGSTRIRVAVPVRAEGEYVAKMLDAARALIAEADAVDQSPADSRSPEAVARRWWARQQA
jgi:hypothetical protein